MSKSEKWIVWFGVLAIAYLAVHAVVWANRY